MRETVEEFGVRIKEAPVKTPGATGVIGRYQAPLRLAYVLIRADTDRYNSDKECLDLAVFAVSNTM